MLTWSLWRLISFQTLRPPKGCFTGWAQETCPCVRAHLEAWQSADVRCDLAQRVLPSDGPYHHGDRVFVWVDGKAKCKNARRWATARVIISNLEGESIQGLMRLWSTSRCASPKVPGPLRRRTRMFHLRQTMLMIIWMRTSWKRTRPSTMSTAIRFLRDQDPEWNFRSYPRLRWQVLAGPRRVYSETFNGIAPCVLILVLRLQFPLTWTIRAVMLPWVINSKGRNPALFSSTCLAHQHEV